MKLYLALAVLLLALAAQSEAQAPEDVGPAEGETLDAKFSQFGERVAELSQDIAAKTKDAFQNIQESEFAVSSRNWFSEQFSKIKAKIDGQ